MDSPNLAHCSVRLVTMGVPEGEHLKPWRFIYIVYRYLYSASHSVSQTKALSVHFSSRKKVRLKARERDKERGAERINEQK